MVSRVSQLCPGAVLQRLDKLVEPLKMTCTLKVGKYVHQLTEFIYFSSIVHRNNLNLTSLIIWLVKMIDLIDFKMFRLIEWLNELVDIIELFDLIWFIGLKVH